jgi:DNA-binding FrmR family transcriptional regulator
MRTEIETREDPDMFDLADMADSSPASPARACCCAPDAQNSPADGEPRTKMRTEAEYKDLIHRLNRIEGQIRGIRNMVERNAYCPDILTQAGAANAALNSFSRVLLSQHIHSCVVQDIRDGKEETLDELMRTIQKLMK